MSSVHPAPFTHRNWRAFLNKEDATATCEWPLYSDVLFRGKLPDLGPYHFLDLQFGTSPSGVSAAFMLRGQLCAEEHEGGNTKGIYHGAPHQQEMAALLSLCLGVRIGAGGLTRWSSTKGDPLGTPLGTVDVIHHPLPVRGHRVPRAAKLPDRLVHLDKEGSLDLLSGFSELGEGDAGALITASRLYQDALWQTESEPHLSWLLLVSAVEAAANSWSTKKAGDVERMTDSHPDVVLMLRDAGGEQLVEAVSAKLAGITGATHKFCSFVLTFDPGPPPGPRMLEVDWSGLRRSLKSIYRWRSRALHGGTPFPAPMCDAPVVSGQGFEVKGAPPGAKAERPFGLAAGTGGAMWDNKETPMLLHVFEHIARGALLRWWRETLNAARQVL